MGLYIRTLLNACIGGVSLLVSVGVDMAHICMYLCMYVSIGK